MKIGLNIWTLIIAAFAIRLIGISQSLWLDEATTARVVQQFNYGQILTQFSPNDFHPPFFYLFMKFWTNIFGYSEIALRFPSILASLLSGLVIYKIVYKACLPAGRSIKSTGVWAAAFYLFNPLVVYYSQEARMYSLATLFITLILYFTLRIMNYGFGKLTAREFKSVSFDKLRMTSVVLANLFIALALGTYYGSIFFIIALYGYLVLKKELRLFAYLLPGTLVAGFLLYPLFITQLKNSGEVLQAIPNWSTTLGKANLKNLVLFPIKFTSGRISWDPKIFYYAIAGAWTLFVSYFVMLNLFQYLKKISKQVRNDTTLLYTLYLLPILLGFLVSFYKPLLQYFRFIYVIPFMSILLAFGANKKWQRVSLLTGFIVFSLIYTYIPNFHREDWKGLAASLPSNKVCALPSSFDPLQYYRPNLITSDARTCTISNGNIVVVPYVEAVYGFNHKEYMSKKNYILTKEVTLRGVSYEQWSKK